MESCDRKLAIHHVQKAFIKGTQCPEQQKAVLELVKPRHFNHFKTLFDASGVSVYPEKHEERTQKASALLLGFMASGSAPKAVVDFVAGEMAGQITVTHQMRINDAFAPKSA